MKENRKVLLIIWYFVIGITFFMGVGTMIDAAYYHVNYEVFTHGQFEVIIAAISLLITEAIRAIREKNIERAKLSKPFKNPINL